MDTPTLKRDNKRRRHLEKRVQEQALVRRFSIKGESVITSQQPCLIVGRTRDTLRLISDEPLAVGERVDIIFDLSGAKGGKTVSGIPRQLAVAYESSGFLVDVEVIRDRNVAAWLRQFH